MSRDVPTTAATLATIAGLSLRRLRRGRTLWIAATIAFLPILFSVVVQRVGRDPGLLLDTYIVELLVLAVLPALFIASAIGDEIEDRTTTYLWSRPIARWSVLIGKLIALAPIALALTVLGWIAAIRIGAGAMPPWRTTVGLGAGVLAISLVATGIASIAPRHGMALTIVYVLLFDLPVGEIPASLQILSITHQARVLAGIGGRGVELGPVLAPALAMAVIGAAWLALGLARIRRLES